jgi:hypothetical protein
VHGLNHIIDQGLSFCSSELRQGEWSGALSKQRMTEAE